MVKPLLINFKPLDSLTPHLHDAVQFIPLIQDLMRESLNIDVRECNSWNELKQIPDNTSIVEFHTSLVRLLDTTPRELLEKIKKCLGNKKPKIVIIIKKATPSNTVEEFKQLGVNGVSLHSLSWSTAERIGSIKAILDSGSHWPESALEELEPVVAPKPITVYFRTDWETRIPAGAMSQIENQNTPFKTMFCGSWKDLSDVLNLAPSQIIFHVDMLTQNGSSVFEFMSMLDTLIRFVVPGANIPIGVSIDRNTPYSLIKDLRKTTVIGIIPSPESFDANETVIGINMLMNRVPYWPKHIIDRLPGAVAKTKQPPAEIKLTDRQTEIFNLICRRGLSNKRIAQILDISESTVKVHISAILKAYRVRNRTQLALSGSAQGLRA